MRGARRHHRSAGLPSTRWRFMARSRRARRPPGSCSSASGTGAAPPPARRVAASAPQSGTGPFAFRRSPARTSTFPALEWFRCPNARRAAGADLSPNAPGAPQSRRMRCHPPPGQSRSPPGRTVSTTGPVRSPARTSTGDSRTVSRKSSFVSWYWASFPMVYTMSTYGPGSSPSITKWPYLFVAVCTGPASDPPRPGGPRNALCRQARSARNYRPR